jgi:SAM-dependent methyltransferase
MANGQTIEEVLASAGDHRPEISAEKEEELRLMKGRIESAFADLEIRGKVFADFVYTFQQLGLEKDQADELCEWVSQRLLDPARLDETEGQILKKFEQITVKVGDGALNLVEVLHGKLKDRADLIFSQLKEYLAGVEGKVVDYGAGDGQVTQKLHDTLGLDIDGYDVRLYPAPNVTIPMATFDGGHVNVPDGSYEAAVMTNVAHHERNNEIILQELSRIVKHRLVVVETVPTGETPEEVEKDRERTFMNDYLYNRLFHNADVPVPGAFETPEKWIERFGKYGWHIVRSENLGIDQPTIKDTHHLLVFER